ncbi:MAG: divalent cation tolerance protein CutA [Patescibacteria group bacterium]
MASKREFCYLYLSCANTVETGEISKALLEQRLVVCTKQLPVSASYWDNGKIDQATEVLLIMESAMDLFEAVEAEVAKIHSYETFVLEAVPITKVSTNAQKWMNENLKNAKQE